MLHSILLIPFSVFRDHRWSAAENEIQQAKKKKKEKIGESHFELHSFPWPASLLEQETRTRPGLLAADLQAWISFMKRRSHKDDLFFFVTPSPLSLFPSFPLLFFSSGRSCVIYQVRREKFIRTKVQAWKSEHVTHKKHIELFQLFLGKWNVSHVSSSSSRKFKPQEPLQRIYRLSVSSSEVLFHPQRTFG